MTEPKKKDEETKLSLSKHDDYDEEHFIERDGEAESIVIVVNHREVVARIEARVQFQDGPGYFIVDRRGHRWALNPQGDNQYELDLHDRTPREVMEEK